MANFSVVCLWEVLTKITFSSVYGSCFFFIDPIDPTDTENSSGFNERAPHKIGGDQRNLSRHLGYFFLFPPVWFNRGLPSHRGTSTKSGVSSSRAVDRWKERLRDWRTGMYCTGVRSTCASIMECRVSFTSASPSLIRTGAISTLRPALHTAIYLAVLCDRGVSHHTKPVVHG